MKPEVKWWVVCPDWHSKAPMTRDAADKAAAELNKSPNCWSTEHRVTDVKPTDDTHYKEGS